MNDTAQDPTRPKGEPQGYFVVLPPAVEEDRFEFGKLIVALLSCWKPAVIGGLVGGAVFALAAMQMPFLYRAEATIAPVESNNSIGSSLRGQFGGLAALAGIDLGSSGTRKEESFATLASLGFARDFITSENLMPVLFPEKWDANAKAWRTDVEAPTMGQAVSVFTRDVRSVTLDRKTGLVNIRVEFTSAELAAHWANRMVELVNDRLRNDATQNSQRSIEYLNRELTKTNVVELRQAIYRLIENQVNNAMLANVQREYAFRFIDRAVAPEKRFSPRRTLLTLLGGILGGMFAIGITLVWRAFARERAASAVQTAA
jgi:hypothetical protein